MLKTESVVTPQLFFALFLSLGTVLVAYLNVFSPGVNGFVVLAGIIGLFAALLVSVKYQYGIYLLMLMGTFMFYVQRLIQTSFPFGIFYDLLVVMTFVALIASRKNKLDWTGFKNGITFTFAILIVLHLVQVLNPAGSFTAWLVSLRNNTAFLLYIVFFHAFFSLEALKKITVFWLVLALLVALYGIYQEVFGLTEFELYWVHKVPERYKLYYIWGNMRKFSFLSDPSSYGIFLAFSGLSCLTLSAMLKDWRWKVLFFISAVTMLVAMSYSGTRTAYATIAAGIALFIFLTIRSRNTMIFATFLVVGGCILMFGPFYNWQVERIRSAFQPSEDASMAVRDVKRISNQAYIQSHPIGGGVFTTAGNGSEYARGHKFAGFDPDSGYLEIALEQGYVGLFLQLVFIAAVVIRGINSYFSIRDPMLRVAVLTYLIPFFALSIAHFAQNALYSKPVIVMVLMALAVMARAPVLDSQPAADEAGSDAKRQEAVPESHVEAQM